jgi:pimeloyl-ACP methyl ester carboxylesterase
VEPACSRAHPDLRARWQATLARPAGDLTGRHLMEAVADALASADRIPRIPALVDDIAHGRLAEARAILAENAGPSSFARGQRLSVWCRDEMPAFDAAAVTAHPELGGWSTVAFHPDVCKAWPVTPSAPARTPVVSAVPTLVVAGEFDPVTPPAWGRRVRATLANGFFVELPGQSHVAGRSPCGRAIISAFLHDPSKLPDLTCVARAE